MAKAKRKQIKAFEFTQGDFPTSLLFVFPLFCLYELGLLWVPKQNGVDFISGTLFASVGQDLEYYLLAQGILILLSVAMLMYWRRVRGFELEEFFPTMAEASIYALTMGTLISFVMGDVLGLVALSRAPLSKEVFSIGMLSLGAGLYEELVFRLLLFSATLWCLAQFGANRMTSLIIALVVSSLAFALAHHVGSFSEVFKFETFLFRSLAGLCFALIFHLRSFAHVVYTHFFYDLYVMLILS